MSPWFTIALFKPAWLLIKRSAGGTENWVLRDTARDTYNPAILALKPNDATAIETADANKDVDILSNGFKLRGTNSNINTNTHTYVYAAFADSPFKYARAR